MAIETASETKERILRVIMFENWLRFYFIVEEDDALFIRLPEQAKAKITEKYGSFIDLATALEEKPIDHEVSLNAVCLYVAQHIDGVTAQMSTTASVFGSAEFQLETYLFNTWVQNHEETLEATFFDFINWEEMYAAWRSSAQVQEYIQTVQEKINQTSTVECPTQ